MFETFPLSVGVANIERFINAMDFLTTYITEHQGDMVSLIGRTHCLNHNQSLANSETSIF